MTTRPIETQLCPPIKSLLEAQGYEVKSEVGAADVVGVREGDADPVIVELKTGFSLTLFHQALVRKTITDWVYIAVPQGKGRAWQGSLKKNKKLCKYLGLGLITVRFPDEHTQIHCDPEPYAPRQNKARKTALLREFERREGDPNIGGSTRQTLITAYRQDAQRLAAFLAENGPSKGAEVRDKTGVNAATRMMRDNHYGWFERHSLGVYGLSGAGITAHKAAKIG